MEQTNENLEFLNNDASANGGQAEPKFVKEEDYKNLQSEYTTTNQERIDLARKLVSKDKSEILNIKDKKLQNRIIQELYGLDNLETLKLIHGDDFYKERSNNGNDDEDEISSVKNELKLLKYKQSKAEMEAALDDFIKDNKELFATEGALEKLNNELQFISTELPVKERIKRASKIAFAISPTDAAYISLVQNVGTGANNSTQETKQKQKIEEEFDRIFGKK